MIIDNLILDYTERVHCPSGRRKSESSPAPGWSLPKTTDTVGESMARKISWDQSIQGKNQAYKNSNVKHASEVITTLIQSD